MLLFIIIIICIKISVKLKMRAMCCLPRWFETGGCVDVSAITRKTRIIDVLYNASNNELVRTKTLVKNCIISIDCTPFRTWYEAHYALPLGKKKGAKLVWIIVSVSFSISNNIFFICSYQSLPECYNFKLLAQNWNAVYVSCCVGKNWLVSACVGWWHSWLLEWHITAVMAVYLSQLWCSTVIVTLTASCG